MSSYDFLAYLLVLLMVYLGKRSDSGRSGGVVPRRLPRPPGDPGGRLQDALGEEFPEDGWGRMTKLLRETLRR